MRRSPPLPDGRKLLILLILQVGDPGAACAASRRRLRCGSPSFVWGVRVWGDSRVLELTRPTRTGRVAAEEGPATQTPRDNRLESLVSLSVTGPAAASAHGPGRATQRIRYAVAFAGLAIFMVAVQFAVGAYRTERGNYSDEAAHFLNGFLISEYVHTGPARRPCRLRRSSTRATRKSRSACGRRSFTDCSACFSCPAGRPNRRRSCCWD